MPSSFFLSVRWYSIFLLCLFLSPSFSQAEVRYVSDYLVVNIRDNVEKPFKTVGAVQSDEQVEVLEKNGKYVKIKTLDGKEGWIKEQYLKKNLPKKVTIENQKKEIESLNIALANAGKNSGLNNNSPNSNFQNDVISLENELKISKQNYDKLNEKYAALSAAGIESGNKTIVSQLQSDLELANSKIVELQGVIDGLKSGEGQSVADKELQELKVQYTNLLNSSENILDITNERDNLLNTMSKKDQTINLLKAQNSELENNQRTYLFIAGAFVFMFGLIFGKLGSKKRNRFTY